MRRSFVLEAPARTDVFVGVGLVVLVGARRRGGEKEFLTTE